MTLGDLTLHGLTTRSKSLDKEMFALTSSFKPAMDVRNHLPMLRDMAPLLFDREQIIGCRPHAPNPPSFSAEAGSSVWSIPILITATVSLSIIFTIFLVRRRRTKLYIQARKKDPTLSRMDFLRRWKMSTAQRHEEDELQRITLIRKALASRKEQAD